MKNKTGLVYGAAFGAALVLTGGFARQAQAADGLPGDEIALPGGTNLLALYNEFSNAGSFGAADTGGTVGHNTRIADDVTILRDVYYFNLGSYTALVQGYTRLFNALSLAGLSPICNI